jgi:hypothetical protein
MKHDNYIQLMRQATEDDIINIFKPSTATHYYRQSAKHCLMKSMYAL